MKYKEKTELNKEFERASHEEDSEKINNIINEGLTKIKYSCFGKVKVYSKDKNKRKLETLHAQKVKVSKEASNKEQREQKLETVDNQMADLMKTIQSNQYEGDLNNQAKESLPQFSIKKIKY